MSKDRAVFFFEEHIDTENSQAYLEFHPCKYSNVVAVRPRIPAMLNDAQREQVLSQLVDQLLVIHRASRPVLWFYTPMMFRFARHLDAAAVVYDCMDELSNFRFAPDGIRQREEELLRRADVVFTGGYSIYEAKRHQHDNIHPFPSSVDRAAFRQGARACRSDPPDQARSGPCSGYYGVIDERIDLDAAARRSRDARPDWTIVMVGPVAKIDPADLPARAEHPLRSACKDYARAADLSRRLGCRADAVRHQRCDALHQPDQDAGISGRRPSGRLDADARCRAPLWRGRGRVHRR